MQEHSKKEHSGIYKLVDGNDGDENDSESNTGEDVKSKDNSDT